MNTRSGGHITVRLPVQIRRSAAAASLTTRIASVWPASEAVSPSATSSQFSNQV